MTERRKQKITNEEERGNDEKIFLFITPSDFPTYLSEGKITAECFWSRESKITHQLHGP